MKRHDDDHYGRRSVDLGADDTPLWAQAPSRQSADERARDVDRLKERLLPVVLEMAERRGPEGITASEVLSEGLVRSILLPAPAHDPRRHSWIGPWLGSLARAGQLAAKMVRLPDGGTLHVKRKSDRHASKQNENGIYLDPKVAA